MKHRWEIEGTCTECKEHTMLEDSCCGAGVECEGHIYYPDDEDEEPSQAELEAWNSPREPSLKELGCLHQVTKSGQCQDCGAVIV